MSKTETNVSNLKINVGSYSAIQSNLSSIGENELIFTEDKNIPIPTSSDSGKLISVDNSGEYILTMPDPSIIITTTPGSESISDGTNTLEFGANAFNSTVIPSTTDLVTQSSIAALTSGGAYTALAGKQDSLTAGNNISISTINNNLTISATDTGATSTEINTSYSELSAYTSFTTSNEYVGYYILVGSTYTEVTDQNKDTLSITPGTTKAYIENNAITNITYDSATRKLTGTKGDSFVRVNDLADVLIPTDVGAVQSKAIADFVNSSINAFAAYYITRNAAGDPFETKAQLDNTSTFYNGGAVRVLTVNDYCIILNDESRGTTVPGYASFSSVDDYIGYYVIYNYEAVEVTVSNKNNVGITAGTTVAYSSLPSTRYSYQGNQWEYQYTINDTSFTAAQLAALNSGITGSLVTQIETNQNNINTLQSGTVTNVSYDSINKKLQQTKNSSTTDIITFGANAFTDTTIPTDYIKPSSASQQTIQLTSGGGTTALGVKSNSTSSYISFSGTSGWLASIGVTSNKKPTVYDGTSHEIAYTTDIPTVNNSTITLQKNSTTVDTFTLNQASAKTINFQLSYSDVGFAMSDVTITEED